LDRKEELFHGKILNRKDELLHGKALNGNVLRVFTGRHHGKAFYGKVLGYSWEGISWEGIESIYGKALGVFMGRHFRVFHGKAFHRKALRVIYGK
jgi:hypothetical protein